VKYYTPQKLLYKKVIFLANLNLTKFSDEVSDGMILTTYQKHMVPLLTIHEEVPDGVSVV